MLQNTKARHIPSSRVETGTIQKQNLSLAVSQVERAPECQELAWKGGGAEQQKRAFLKGQWCAQAALWREAVGCEGSTWGRDALRLLQRAARSCCSPSGPPVLQHGQWVCSQKIRMVLTCNFSPFCFHLIIFCCPEKALLTCSPRSLL